MKKGYIILAVVAFALLVAIFFWRANQKSKQPTMTVSVASEVTNQLQTSVTAAVPANSLQAAANPQVTNSQSPPSGASEVEKWKWLHEMLMKDRYFEYKAPISFYGRVVDDAGNPISGVSIDLSWTDANEATGASSRTVISDGNGLFSIEGVHGNGLSVMSLTKQGYKESLAQNTFTFHYGYFSDPYYHSPDAMNPVVFVMRKNRQGEALIVRSRQEAQLESGGQSKSFPIGAGDVFVSVERLPDETPNARYWNARVTVPNGGLQLTTEEFPYEAPEEGYANEFIITNGLSVQGNQGGMFYVKTPKGYGRVMVYYIPNMPWVYAESWFNPNPASRNLEPSPNK